MARERVASLRRACSSWIGLITLTACGDAGIESVRAETRRAPAAVSLPERGGPSPVQFVDATAESGVTFVADFGAAAQEWRYVETFGSGVVAFDGDGDGDVDLLFLNGRGFGARAEPARGNSYWRNDGGFRFVDATAESGLGGDRYALGGCSGDYDNDGDQDLYVTHFEAANALYRNDGDGRFEDVAAAAGVTFRPDAIKSACAFADIDGDGWLDLFAGACVDQRLDNHRECWDSWFEQPDSSVRRYCNPSDFRALPDALFRSNGDGTFREVTAEAGMAEFVGRTLGALFVDLDDDRDQDLFVACDRSPNALWINQGGGRFLETAESAGLAYDEAGRAQSGMGVTSGDYDGDGKVDLAATYFEREPNGLYRQATIGEFESTAGVSNTGATSFPLLGWGTELFDADLDGRLDWVIVNGHVQPHIDRLRRPERSRGYAQPPLFFLNRGDGKFESLAGEAGEPFASRYVGRGLAAADLDDDGDLDLVLNNCGAPAVLLRNDSPRAGRHWLGVRLVGSASNRDGLGARVVIEAGGNRQFRDIHSGGSFLSQSDRRAFFGVATAPRIERLEVRWPSGATTTLTDLAADQLLTLTEP